jgi:type I restriction enzyme S subunit
MCTVRHGRDHKSLKEGKIPVYGSGGLMRYVDRAIHSKKSVLIPRKGTLGNLFFAKEPFWTVDTLFWTDIKEDIVVPEYLYYCLKTKNLASMNVGTAVPSLTTALLNDIDIDLPPIEEQQRIVDVLVPLDEKIACNTMINHHLAS